MPQTAVVCIAPSAQPDFVISPVFYFTETMSVCGGGGEACHHPNSQHPTHPQSLLQSRAWNIHTHRAPASNNSSNTEAMFKTADIEKC